MKPRIHVIGGGLSGLSAAFYAARAGCQVHLYEAAPHFGGRFRSVPAPLLGQQVDNGTHLLLGANRHMLGFLRQTGCADLLAPAPADYHLFGSMGDHWRLTPFSWPMGWREMAVALGGRAGSVQQALGAQPHWTIWHSLAVSILNTPAQQADHSMFARVLRRVLCLGPLSLRPFLFPHGLSPIVDRVTACLASMGCRLYPAHRWQGMGERCLRMKGRTLDLSPDDRIVLALPPDASYPCQPIINVHYRLPDGLCLSTPQPFAALCGGPAHWLSQRGDILTATISAAQCHLHQTNVAAQVWQQCQPYLGQKGENVIPRPCPPFAIIKERRATLRHDSHTLARRPGPATENPQIWRAGDWLQGPWPCTMEAAVRSGKRAIALILESV